MSFNLEKLAKIENPGNFDEGYFQKTKEILEAISNEEVSVTMSCIDEFPDETRYILRKLRDTE